MPLHVFDKSQSVTDKPGVSATVSTSFWVFFAVPVLIATVILLIVLFCWCIIKRDRVHQRARFPRPGQRTKRPQPLQQKQQQQQQQLQRKFFVANNSRRPPSGPVVNSPVSGPAETTVYHGSDCTGSKTDLERCPLQESADKPAKLTTVRFTGRFVVKLIEALSGLPRRQQLDQLSTTVDIHRMQTLPVSDVNPT